MRRKLCSLMIVLLLLPLTAFAQKANSNWADVQNLKIGTKIVVITRNGREFAGTKRQATDDTLFMDTKFPVQGNRTISLTRAEIGQVSKMKSKWFYPLIGVGIGIGVGVAIGSTADHPGSDDPGLGKALGAGLGGAIGLAAGSGFARKPGTKTIYLAP
jgi:hypothetical protein